MYPDLERLTKSFLLPRRALSKRLTMAAIASSRQERGWGTWGCTLFAKRAAKIFARARRYGARFPDGEDSTTFIQRKFAVYSELFWIIDRVDERLPVKKIWIWYKCVNRWVDPERAKQCLYELSEKFVFSGKILARDVQECPETVHQLLLMAIWYINDGWTPGSTFARPPGSMFSVE